MLKTLGLVTLFQLGVTTTLQAAIFKCVSETGAVLYLDKPCPVNHDEESFEHAKDPENTTRNSAPPMPEVAIRQNFKTNKVVPVNDRKLNSNGNISQAALSSATTKEGYAAKSVGGIPAAGGSSKSRRLDESGLPAGVDKSSLEEMGGALVESLSQLKVF